MSATPTPFSMAQTPPPPKFSMAPPQPPPQFSMAPPPPPHPNATMGTFQPTPGTIEDNKCCFSTPLDFVCPFCFIVPERVQIVQLFFGAYHGTITKPGCYCRTGCALEMRRIGTGLITHDLPHTKVLDARANPVVVSGIVAYYVADSRAAAIDVIDAHSYVRDQAPAVLKRITSMYPYDSEDPSVPTLRRETGEINRRMRDALQQRCAPAGVKIESFNINELSYAPEIASSMLRRQQAEALVDARKAIVRGVKQIAKEAVEDVGTDMSAEQRASLLGNLLVVLVGEKDVTPTISV